MLILERGMDVHLSLASAEIKPLHQLMEEMLVKMIASVTEMVCASVYFVQYNTMCFMKNVTIFFL